MQTENLPEYIKYLLQQDSYPHPVSEVRLVQTHISFVTIAGDYVYKWKKTVDFGFLDFSTLEKRKFYCEQELLLNRRLCPELYLEVVAVTREPEGLVLNGEGDVVEYGLKMARMPEDRMMGKVISRGELTDNHLDQIVDALVPFYQSADGSEAIQEFGTSQAVAVNVLENFDQTEEFVGGQSLSREQFETIKSFSKAVLADEGLFRVRVADGRIRDCHGDLYSANICLDSPVHIFDCIEFNERFRFTDVAADVGFLAMDLDYHGLEEQSEYFIRRYIEQAGDDNLLSVLDFYKCYRAYVRGKIGLFTANDPAVDTSVAQQCLEDAARYFQLAARYATSNDGSK